MNKLLLLLLCVPLLFSCGEKNAKDINVSLINDECELLDSYLIVFDGMIELVSKYSNDDWSNVPTVEIEKYKMLERKAKEIQDKFSKERWNDEVDVEYCINFKKFKKSEKELRKLLGLDHKIELKSNEIKKKQKIQDDLIKMNDDLMKLKNNTRLRDSTIKIILKGNEITRESN